MTDSELFPDFEFLPKPPVTGAGPVACLMDLLARVRSLKPWDVLENEHLIGLDRNDGNSGIELISVSGSAGKYFAIQLHLPPQGPDFYRRIFAGEDPGPGPGMENVKFLECGFSGSRKTKLRSYRPGFVPADLDETEVNEFSSALKLFLYHYPAISANIDQFYLWYDRKKMPVIPVLTLQEGREPTDPANWKIVTREFPSAESTQVNGPEDIGLHPEYAKRDIVEETWEISLTWLREPIEPGPGEGDRPYFPKMVAAVHDDPDDCEVLHPDIYPGHTKSDSKAIQDFFRKFTDDRGFLPSLVRTATEVEKRALQGIADSMGFQIEIEEMELLPDFLKDFDKDSNIGAEVDKLMTSLPQGDPVRRLLLEGHFEEAFELLEEREEEDAADNIITVKFG